MVQPKVAISATFVQIALLAQMTASLPIENVWNPRSLPNDNAVFKRDVAQLDERSWETLGGAILGGVAAHYISKHHEDDKDDQNDKKGDDDKKDHRSYLDDIRNIITKRNLGPDGAASNRGGPSGVEKMLVAGVAAVGIGYLYHLLHKPASEGGAKSNPTTPARNDTATHAQDDIATPNSEETQPSLSERSTWLGN